MGMRLVCFLTDEDKMLMIMYWFSYKSLKEHVTRLKQK